MEVAHKLFGRYNYSYCFPLSYKGSTRYTFLSTTISLSRLPWRDLFTPVISLCRNGFNMTNHSGKVSDTYVRTYVQSLSVIIMLFITNRACRLYCMGTIVKESHFEKCLFKCKWNAEESKLYYSCLYYASPCVCASEVYGSLAVHLLITLHASLRVATGWFDQSWLIP